MPEGITRQVSRDVGSFPVWVNTGRQLSFRRVLPSEPDEFIGVTVTADGSLGPQSVVARGEYANGRNAFDVFPDGSLLMIQDVDQPPLNLGVVVNWPALRQLTSSR